LCYASNRHSASPETSARVGSTGRGSAICRGALSLKILFIHPRDPTRAPLRGRAVLTHARPFGREQAQVGLRTLTGVVVGHSVPLPVWRRGLARRRLVRFS